MNQQNIIDIISGELALMIILFLILASQGVIAKKTK